MSNQEERAGRLATVRVIEVVGISTESWEDAASQAVDRVAKSNGHVTGVELLRSTATVREGKIAEYHADVKVAFVVQPAHADA